MDFKLGDQVMLKVNRTLPMGTAGKVLKWGRSPSGEHYYQIFFYGLDNYSTIYNIQERKMDELFVRLKRIPDELEIHFPKTRRK